MQFLTIYKRLMRVLCAVGCVYQSYNLSRIYFSYKTTTNVRYETLSDTYLPAITVCTNTKFTQFQDQFLKQYGKTSISEKLNIEQQFNAMKDVPDKLKDCWVSSPDGHGDCQGASNYTHYIDLYTYCFTLFPQLNGEKDERYKIEEFEKSLAYFYLKRETLDMSNPDDKIRVYLHSRDQTLLKDDEEGAIIMSLKNFGVVTIDYYVVIIEYKFRPYGECLMGQSRSQCVYKCIVDKIVEKYDKYPHNYLTRDKNSALMIEDQDYDVDEEQCKQSCDLKTECFKQFFVNNHMNLEGDDQGESVKISINKPSFPATIYEINLKMSLEEYLCLLSSIFSLWFGFSVMLFTDFCPVMLKKFKTYLVNYYNIKFTQNNKAIVKIKHGRRSTSTAMTRRY